MSQTEPEAQSKGWWARQSSAIRAAIVGVVIVAVGVVSFLIVNSVSSSSPQSPAALASQESKTTDLLDLGSYCFDTESNWLIYTIGSESSTYETPALLSSAPGREASMAAYLRQHRYPAALARDVDRSETIFAQTYLHLVATVPKPAAGSLPKAQYLDKLYTPAWNAAISAEGSYCTADGVALERQIVAVPLPNSGGPQQSYTLP